eukprot:1019979-Pyramimonas_sp.AAC.1
MKCRKHGPADEPYAGTVAQQHSQVISSHLPKLQKASDPLPHSPEPLHRGPSLVALAVKYHPQYLDAVTLDLSPMALEPYRLERRDQLVQTAADELSILADRAHVVHVDAVPRLLGATRRAQRQRLTEVAQRGAVL